VDPPLTTVRDYSGAELDAAAAAKRQAVVDIADAGTQTDRPTGTRSISISPETYQSPTPIGPA